MGLGASTPANRSACSDGEVVRSWCQTEAIAGAIDPRDERAGIKSLSMLSAFDDRPKDLCFWRDDCSCNYFCFTFAQSILSRGNHHSGSARVNVNRLGGSGNDTSRGIFGSRSRQYEKLYDAEVQTNVRGVTVATVL